MRPVRGPGLQDNAYTLSAGCPHAAARGRVRGPSRIFRKTPTSRAGPMREAALQNLRKTPRGVAQASISRISHDDRRRIVRRPEQEQVRPADGFADAAGKWL